MHIQLNKVLAVVALLSFIFMSHPGGANSEAENHNSASLLSQLSDILKKVKDLIPSSVEDMKSNPAAIIGLCIAVVILAVVFRGLIFFMIIFGVLIMMFGSIEKVKEKLNFEKDILQSDSEKKDKN